MDAARRERRLHGTPNFPFQIYPSLNDPETQDSDFVPYHWHPELEIIMVDGGTVELTIADRHFSARKGDVFFVGAEKLHEIRAAGPENTFRAFVFPLEFLEFQRADLVQSDYLAPMCAHHLAFPMELRADAIGQQEIHAALDRILHLSLQRKPGYQIGIKAALLSILSTCAEYGLLENHETGKLDYKAQQLKDIVGYLGAHFSERLTLSETAARFGMSPQYFCTFFHENLGRTLTQHINSLRIEQASRILRETDLPIMEVGFSVGFENFSYFIKRFREVYGVSPSAYRKASDHS